jgi:hypothetical protein
MVFWNVTQWTWWKSNSVLYIPSTSISSRSYRLCSVTTIDCNLESQTFCKCNVAIAVLEQLENFASSSILHYHWHTTFTLQQTFIQNFGKEDGTLHTVSRLKKQYYWVKMIGRYPMFETVIVSYTQIPKWVVDLLYTLKYNIKLLVKYVK